MTLPTDAKARKDVPIYSGFVKYFPRAMAAVAELSRIGNEQHNPGKPLHWDRSKSGDELDAAMRHLVEAGAVDIDGVRHSTKLAWRAMANLEKELERAEQASEADPRVAIPRNYSGKPIPSCDILYQHDPQRQDFSVEAYMAPTTIHHTPLAPTTETKK